MVGLGWVLAASLGFAQGGPPYYTNDPGTPGNLNWEINLGYMPFYYRGQSLSHVPDVDINFGVGERIQLTYESAWLRVQNPGSPAKFGMNQSNPGVSGVFTTLGKTAYRSRYSLSFFSTIRTMPYAAASLPRPRGFSCLSNSPGNSGRWTWTTNLAISLTTRGRTTG